MSHLMKCSRYKHEFVELEPLGEGGFGSVFKAKNNLDGCIYAIKKVPLKEQGQSKILREVSALSRLTHKHIVRYHQSWIELAALPLSKSQDTGNSSDSSDFSFDDGNMSDGLDDSSLEPSKIFEDLSASASFDLSLSDPKSSDSSTLEQRQTQILYIQMEYCPQTLRQELDTKRLWSQYTEDDIWILFRQIVVAIEYLHNKDCIHRDLKPSNIFLSESGAKLGDFGLVTGDIVLRRRESLAFFPRRVLRKDSLQRGEAHRSAALGDMTFNSGTYFYTSPRKISELYARKQDLILHYDIYALGIILLELWYPFDTDMERVSVIETVRSSHQLPPRFVEKYHLQSNMILRLTNPNYCLRPTATEILQELYQSKPSLKVLPRKLAHSSDDCDGSLREQVQQLTNRTQSLTTENDQLKKQVESMAQTIANLQSKIHRLNSLLLTTSHE